MKPTLNLAQQWATTQCGSVEQARMDYEACCIDFAGDFLAAHGKGRLAYFNDINHPTWRYHAAPEIDGMIHDLWHDEVMPTKQFLKKVMLGGWVDYPADQPD